MKILNSRLAILLISTVFYIGCSGDKATTEGSVKTGVEVNEPVEQASPEQDVNTNSESTLGQFTKMLGSWSVDAETAGVAMQMTLNEDGSFSHMLGDIRAEGTWEVVDEKHIKIVTPNVKDGQTWLISNLTETGVDVCWNPESSNPKTIPFTRSE